MPRRLRAPFAIALSIVVMAGLFAYANRRRPAPLLPAAPMQREPQLMLWAWESAQDFTTLDPQHTGVAFLARELLLDTDLTVRPRYQPMRVGPATWLIAVVRIEVGPHFVPNEDLAARSARAIADAAQLTNVRAVQIDFDATATRRDFYAKLVRDLRSDLPSGLPISLTALVSWCGPHSWIHGLPVDEAVPMFFRMGGPASTRATSSRSQDAVAEPLCSGSAGLSTDETWPVVRSNQRVYMFHPGSWTQNEIARVNRFGYEGLRGPSGP